MSHPTCQVGGETLQYTATAGLLPIMFDETDGAVGSIFFVAYTLERPAGAGPRPLTFAFNGGPGSCSIWLHLGGLGPKKVALLPDGGQPAPPYHLEDSQDTWLPDTDLVFIDAMGAGFSRPATLEDGLKFFGVQEVRTKPSPAFKMHCRPNRLEQPSAIAPGGTWLHGGAGPGRLHRVHAALHGEIRPVSEAGWHSLHFLIAKHV